MMGSFRWINRESSLLLLSLPAFALLSPFLLFADSPNDHYSFSHDVDFQKDSPGILSSRSKGNPSDSTIELASSFLDLPSLPSSSTSPPHAIDKNVSSSRKLRGAQHISLLGREFRRSNPRPWSASLEGRRRDPRRRGYIHRSS